MVFATFTYFYAAICNIAASEIVPGKYLVVHDALQEQPLSRME
jgi:hypothetical protein